MAVVMIRQEEKRLIVDTLLTYSNSAETCLAAADLCELLAVAFEPPTPELAQGLTNGGFTTDVLACLEELGVSATQVAEIAPALMAAEGEDAETLYATMKQEYSHLFAHPKHPLVWRYETMFKEAAGQSKEPPSLFISPTCLHVEQLMKKAGVSLGADNKQPADFVANELHFASYLLTRCASEAVACEGEKDAEVLTDGEKDPDGPECSACAASLNAPAISDDPACTVSPQAANGPKQTEALAVLTDFYQQHLTLWLPGFMQQVAEKTTLGVYRSVAQVGLLLVS